MKKIIIATTIAALTFLTACGGSSTPTTQETTAVQTENASTIEETEEITDLHIVNDLKSEYIKNVPEQSDEMTMGAITVFADQYDDVLNCKDVSEVPEEYLFAIAYFYASFNVNSSAGGTGTEAWIALNCLEDSDDYGFEEHMKAAKEEFESGIGMTIEEFSEAAAEATAEETTADTEATLSEQNALKKALQYLDYSSFSKSGLEDQLDYEGFTKSEIKYAIKNCGADWNEQAAKKAQSYMEYSSFSKERLIEQLEYEGFTHDQAIYGAESVGY